MENTPPTLDTSDAEPIDIISTVQALQIRGVKNKGMREVLNDLLAKDGIREWESLLTAAPSALHAIGQCFIIAMSGNVAQIMQRRDNTIPADLRTNLVRCSDLGLGAFAEAEDKVANLATTIAVITEYRGIMDKILNSIDDIRNAFQSASYEDLQASQEELTEQLGDLGRCARVCTEDSGSVIKKFTEWLAAVRKISLAYTEAQWEETENRRELQKEREDFLAQLRMLENADENPALLRQIGRGIIRWIKKNEGTTPEAVRRHLEDLNTQHMDKESALRVLESCLDNLKRISESFELLNRLFRGLHRQIEDLSGMRLSNFIRDVSAGRLTKSQLDDIHYDVYKIRCQFAHTESKASTYVEASQKFIMPTIKFLYGLDSGSGMSRRDMEKLLMHLRERYEESCEGAHALAERTPTHAQLVEQIESGRSNSEE